MSKYRIKQDINSFEIVDEYTKRISRVIDEQTLANVENQLAEYGYEKVTRCKDCKYLYVLTYDCCVCALYKDKFMPFVELDDFCSRGKRRENDA